MTERNTILLDRSTGAEHKHRYFKALSLRRNSLCLYKGWRHRNFKNRFTYHCPRPSDSYIHLNLYSQKNTQLNRKKWLAGQTPASPCSLTPSCWEHRFSLKTSASLRLAYQLLKYSSGPHEAEGFRRTESPPNLLKDPLGISTACGKQTPHAAQCAKQVFVPGNISTGKPHWKGVGEFWQGELPSPPTDWWTADPRGRDRLDLARIPLHYSSRGKRCFPIPLVKGSANEDPPYFELPGYSNGPLVCNNLLGLPLSP